MKLFASSSSLFYKEEYGKTEVNRIYEAIFGHIVLAANIELAIREIF
jgi:hypothetical protein